MNLRMNIQSKIRIAGLLLLALCSLRTAAQVPEDQTASVRLGRLWVGIVAHGAKTSFNYLAGFFPNDYNILANTGQDADAFGGLGLRFTATAWQHDLTDSVHTVAIYGPQNDFMPDGQVVVPMLSAIRYPYPAQNVDYTPIAVSYPGAILDPSQMGTTTCDQVVDVTTMHVFNVQVHRRVLAWTQSRNDDYIIVDLELTNVGTDPLNDTLNNFYVSMFEGNRYMQISSVSNPAPPSNEYSTSGTLPATWLHYYGGRVGDTARVFYEYSASNPNVGGDNMGAPSVTQGGRLLYAQMSYYTILHASTVPYTDPANDIDDFTQPRVTYIGSETRMPNPAAGTDEFGSKNFWAIRGGFSDYFPMDTINSWPGTHHSSNNDDIGLTNYSAYPSGTNSNGDQKRYASFGPYTFLPGQKLHFVYASGVTGLNLRLAKQIGEQWLNGTLQNPSGMPDSDKGWLPKNFAFPVVATEMDKRKDRWISSGIDSVFKSAWRAKWNYDHQYAIPQSPPPPSNITIIGNGDGVAIQWRDAAAEVMSGFAGYRIMRRVGGTDTSFYQEIYSSDATDKGAVHNFKDVTAKVGAQYYYYVQSKALIDPADPTADPSSRGQVIYSSRLLIPNVTKINPRYPPVDDMSKIRVVPNPYNVNDPIIPQYGWTDNRGLFFINLPSDVTIRIYTENGDLVCDVHHNDAVKNGLFFWNMISNNQQVINSGVYIALFQKPDGSVSYQKFVVVR